MIAEEQIYVRPLVRIRNRTVRDVIPGIFPGLMGAFQMILWLAIIGLESASLYYDAGRGIIYAGYWCSSVFLVTWITMFCYLCCGKSTGCGIYLLIQNIINLIFVIVLIVFTALFINNPCLCYGILCEIKPWDVYAGSISGQDTTYWVSGCTARTFQKLPVLKALLSCAVLMLVSNIVIIAVYFAVFIWLMRKPKSYIEKQSTVLPPYQPYPVMYLGDQYQQQLHPVVSVLEHYYASESEAISEDNLPRDYVQIRSENF